MTALSMATMSNLVDCYDMSLFTLKVEQIQKYLRMLKQNYSFQVFKMISDMVEIEE